MRTRHIAARARRGRTVRTAATLIALTGLFAVSGCGVPRYVDDARRDAAVDARLLQAPASGCPAPQTFTRPPGTTRKVALTFDDGPTPGTTEQILAILAEEGVKATFFDLGLFSREYPDLQRATWEAGHTIGVHAYDHTDLTTVSPEQARSEMERTAREIIRNTGAPVCFARPPYGATNAAVRNEIYAQGFSQVLWNIDSRDWVKPGTGTITQDATRVIDTTPVTVLMHASLPETPDGSDAPLTSTVASLRPVIQAYKRMGYEFVQVDGTPFPLRGAATVSAASGASPSR
ncbi:MAG: polysaccharide deacetylase family protein [Dermatophilus congolensis]|nr:polysaccharide deacetylase family protein [Dermatophilus congolensis]